jgi:hypothetical protein
MHLLHQWFLHEFRLSVSYLLFSFAHYIHKSLTHIGIQKVNERPLTGVIKSNLLRFKKVQDSFVAGYDDKIGIYDLSFNKKNEVSLNGRVNKILSFGSKVFVPTTNPDQ